MSGVTRGELMGAGEELAVFTQVFVVEDWSARSKISDPPSGEHGDDPITGN
jgi:hypothetical protein